MTAPELVTTGDDGRPRLLGGRCGGCGEHHFPRGAVCPWCSADAVEAVELSTEGTLWGWTGVAAAPPGYEGEVPFGFGVVELPEGIRIVTRLTEPDPEKLSFGQAMHLTAVGDTYAFAPEPETR